MRRLLDAPNVDRRVESSPRILARGEATEAAAAAAFCINAGRSSKRRVVHRENSHPYSHDAAIDALPQIETSLFWNDGFTCNRRHTISGWVSE
jgi:hypothetical protein